MSALPMGFFDFLKRKELARIAELEDRYAQIMDIDAEIATKRKELAIVSEQLNELKDKYRADRQVYDDLKRQLDIFRDDLDISEYGVYAPHFEFDTSDLYKEYILRLRDEMKELIADGHAVVGGEGITWNNSLSAGQAMVKRQKKLLLRAFNGECDSFIASVSWNNYERMVARIEKSYDAINKVYEKQGIYITENYKAIKLKELEYTHLYRLKKKEEKDEQRELREQMREDERVAREIENAKLQAEKEERMYLQALEKARKEIGKAVGDKHAKLLEKIAELEAGLLNAETLKQKAISMAEQTKMGYVYVISNIGSFGEGVYKIGMTRRLEPMDRVRELGDASVPFLFDVHAMIFSENAPELERQLHLEFDKSRVNLVNPRKEFFKVSLEEIRKVAEKLGAKVDFMMLAEAEEYRRTLHIRNTPDAKQQDFPSEL